MCTLDAPAIPFSRHERVVLDDGLFRMRHIFLTTFYRRREPRVVLRDDSLPLEAYEVFRGEPWKFVHAG
jgi:hypothetical protein